MLENCSRFNEDFGFYTVMETSGKALELEKPTGVVVNQQGWVKPSRTLEVYPSKS